MARIINNGFFGNVTSTGVNTDIGQRNDTNKRKTQVDFEEVLNSEKKIEIFKPCSKKNGKQEYYN